MAVFFRHLQTFSRPAVLTLRPMASDALKWALVGRGDFGDFLGDPIKFGDKDEARSILVTSYAALH